jgi:excisionase family DNA binding protein
MENINISEILESYRAAYRLAADSKLPGFKVGGTWRFRRVDIEEWIEREASPKKDKKR